MTEAVLAGTSRAPARCLVRSGPRRRADSATDVRAGRGRALESTENADPGAEPDATRGSEAAGGESDAERARAFENIRSAAKFFGVAMQETDWRQLGRRPRNGRTPEDRKESARKAAATRKRNERRQPDT